MALGCTDDFKPNIPEVTTLEATEITDISAALISEFSFDEITYSTNAEINAYYYLSEDPAFTDEDKTDASVIMLKHQSSGKYYWYLYDLTPNTTYYFAFALSDGVVEVRGETLSFTTAEAVKPEATLQISDAEDRFIFSGEVTGIREFGNLFIEFSNMKEEPQISFAVTNSWSELIDSPFFYYEILHSDLSESLPEGTYLCRLIYKTLEDEVTILCKYQEFTMPKIQKAITYWALSELFLYNSETGAYGTGETFYLYLTYISETSFLYMQSVEGWGKVSFHSDNNFMWIPYNTDEHSFYYTTGDDWPEEFSKELYWAWTPVEDYFQTSGSLFIRNNSTQHILKISPGYIFRQ